MFYVRYIVDGEVNYGPAFNTLERADIEAKHYIGQGADQATVLKAISGYALSPRVPVPVSYDE